MRNYRVILVAALIAAMAVPLFAQKKTRKAAAHAGGIDRAYLQKIWNGWESLDGQKQAEFYAKGKHLFFDIAPVKYTSWEEYESGVNKILADYKSAKFTVQDDAEIHPAGEYVWAASTVKADMERKNGKRELSTMRWTVVFAKEAGKWLIVHEHVSEPVGE